MQENQSHSHSRRSTRFYPNWWPENPYPENVFPMTLDDYVRAIPDEKQRTAISGCLGRLFWDKASEAIFAAVVENLPVRKEGKDSEACRDLVLGWMAKHQISYRQLERKTGIAAPNLNAMMNGKRTLTPESILRIFAVMD